MNSDVIVIGQNYSTALGVIRAVGFAGYKCEVFKILKKSPSQKPTETSSVFVSGWTYAIDSGDENAVIEKLIKLSDKDKKKLIIPADDNSACLIDNHLDTLSKYFICPQSCGVQGGISKCMDKGYQKELALNSGLFAAKGVSVFIDDNGKYIFPDDIIYPCYTKPQMSVGNSKGYIRKCVNETELKHLLDEVAGHGKNEILIEEFLEIEKEYVVPGFSNGEKVFIPAFLQKKKIGSGEHKGVTAMGTVIDASKMQDVCSSLEKFVGKMNFTGLFDIELIESNKKIYFNEMNMRYGAAGYAVTASGVNLPAMFADFSFDKEINTGKLEDGKTFVSEKAQADDFFGGFCSYKTMKNEIKSSQIKFIECNKDMMPYKVFCRNFKIKRIKKLLGR